MNADIAERLLGHNEWATRLVLEHCRPLSPEQFTRKLEIGPGSLHDTLLHTVGAMERWADRIGERELRPSIEDEDRTWTPDEIIARLAEAADDLGAVIRTVIEEDRVNEQMEVRIRGYAEPFVFTRGTAFVHVMTHGVHHRAQTLNMMRQLGVDDIPDVDAVDWELSTAAASG
jgi:uncharacterized damage-inducible protein DinB